MAIDWSAVKEDFREGKLSAEKLAKKYGCRETTLRRRAEKEGWAGGSGEKGDGAGAKAHAHAPETQDVLDDGSLWKGVRKRLVSGLHNNDAKLGLEELKVAKMAGEVLSSVIKGERLALGLDSEGDDQEEIAREMARFTLPHGADAADGGE